MLLDIRTIIVILIIMYLLSSLFIWFLYIECKNISGIKDWSIGFLLLSLGFLLTSARGFIPSLMSIVVGNGAHVVAFLVIYKGICRFFGLHESRLLSKLILITSLILLFIWHVSDIYLPNRIALMSFVPALYFLMCTVSLLRSAHQSQFFRRICGYFFALNVVAMVARGVWALMGPPIAGDAMNAGAISYLIYAWCVVFDLSLTILFVLMTSERLQDELTARLRELDEANRTTLMTLNEQRNFLAMVSHEFRTPLGIIMAANDVIRCCDVATDQDIVVETERIRRAGSRLNNLVDRCLADEWLNVASEQSNFVSVDLPSVLSDVTREMDVRLLNEVGDDIPVRGDRYLLPIVFTNLIDNGRKFAAHPESVAVRILRSSDNSIAVEVADDGPGVEPSEQGRIFEKFYRSASVSHKPGAGLGLYLANRIIAQHKGKIELIQVNGTVFRVILPIQDAEL